jgi:hypothetical protein
LKARKSEQQLTLEERHRFWTAKLKKARTLSQQIAVEKIIKDIEARLWPSPVDEAVAVAKAAKMQLKAAKEAAARAKEAEAAEQERFAEVERRKVWEETNPVLDHVKLAVIRQELAQPVPEALIEESTEMVEITRQAEESAKKQSKEREAVENPPIAAPQSDVLKAGDGIASPALVSPGLTDMFRVVSKPRDGEEHDGSVGMTNALPSCL